MLSIKSKDRILEIIGGYEYILIREKVNVAPPGSKRRKWKADTVSLDREEYRKILAYVEAKGKQVFR